MSDPAIKIKFVITAQQFVEKLAEETCTKRQLSTLVPLVQLAGT